MQPILVVSPDPRLAEASRQMLPEGPLPVFFEPDWLRALELAIHRPMAAILVDVHQPDAFTIGRLLRFRTRRPVLFVESPDHGQPPADATDPAAAGLTTTPVQTGQEGWTPLVDDDIAASKRTATHAVVAADLIRRSPRRFG